MRLADLTRASRDTGATGDAATSIESSMNPWISRGETTATPLTLDSATARRIEWLFERVCRHGYGAEHSLRLAVQLGAIRMAEAGATRDAIRAAIVACVHGQMPADAVQTVFVPAEFRVVSIRKRVTAWADAAFPPSQQGAVS